MKFFELIPPGTNSVPFDQGIDHGGGSADRDEHRVERVDQRLHPHVHPNARAQPHLHPQLRDPRDLCGDELPRKPKRRNPMYHHPAKRCG